MHCNRAVIPVFLEVAMAVTNRFLSIIFVMLLLSGCATIPRDFEEPTLTVISIALRDSNALAPQFDIVMHVTNPNRVALDLVGMSYSVQLAGNKVVTGVANNLPVVEAYGEADILISAAVNLFGSIRLLNDLMIRNPDQIEYVFDARLDVGTMMPRININKTGMISLRPTR